MKTDTEIKNQVQKKYAEIASQSKDQNLSSCCGSSCCSEEVYNIMADDYTKLEGYNRDADLGLGCGLPTAFAKIKAGDTVIDLGCGAGNDCFVARSITGENGKVIGIDFTEKMISLARENAEKLKYHNVEFRFGDIEQIPVTSNTADVVVSNCVLNLVPNKSNVFKDIFRVLKPGGHFSISDIVLQGELPAKWKEIAELYAGCVSGAVQKTEYMNIIEETGFTNITLQKEKLIVIPDDILAAYLNADEIIKFKAGQTSILSITVYAEKPIENAQTISSTNVKACCGPECCN